MSSEPETKRAVRQDGGDALPEAHALAYTARVFRLPVGQPVFYRDVFPQGWGLLRDNRKKYGFCQ